MITLSSINPAILIKESQSSQDNTAAGYLEISMNTSDKNNSIILSNKALSSVGIDVSKLSKDNNAYVAIFPEVDTNAAEHTVNWYVAQFAIPLGEAEKKEELAKTIKTGGKYRAYRIAKLNKAKRNINSAIMHDILVNEFGESQILLIPNDAFNTSGKFKLISKSVFDAQQQAAADSLTTQSLSSADGVGGEAVSESMPNEIPQQTETTTETNDVDTIPVEYLVADAAETLVDEFINEKLNSEVPA